MSISLFDYLPHSPSSPVPALESASGRIDLFDLQSRVEKLAENLRQSGATRVAIYADNGIQFIVADLACQLAGHVAVPLPLFFSAGQLRHAVATSGADTVIADRDIAELLPDAVAQTASGPLPLAVERFYRVTPREAVSLPAGTQKITFTSGTTGTPKGVCLSVQQQLRVAVELAAAIALDHPRHLCVLPMSTLLENLAGIYAPLIAGGVVVVPSLEEVGLAGSSGLDVKQWLSCIDRHQPNSLILVPEMLSALVLAAEAGWRTPSTLQFVAVGGGKVAKELLRRAHDAGIPAYEGYGLSECSSVVSLNVPGAVQTGSAGRPLPHVNVVTRNNEIVIEGNVFLGYVDQPDSWGCAEVRTGDLGRIDEDGFVHVEGRIKNQMITSFGRNISPEWVESELLAGPFLQQAVVVGDNRPYCVALVYARDAFCSRAEIEAWIASVNRRLPDYARIRECFVMPTALTVQSGHLTANGRPRRAQIHNSYQHEIESMYDMQIEARAL